MAGRIQNLFGFRIKTSAWGSLFQSENNLCINFQLVIRKKTKKKKRSISIQQGLRGGGVGGFLFFLRKGGGGGGLLGLEISVGLFLEWKLFGGI